MKKLSIEEKARAYDKVLKEVKDFFEGRTKMYSDVTQALEFLFPELKESKDFPKLIENEDERIRKQIISFLKEFENDHYRNLDFSFWIAWLEKQGEHKEIDWDEEIKKCKANPLYFFDKYVRIKLKEQKPTDKVKPKFKVGDWIVYDNDKFHAIALIVAIDCDMYKVELYNGINCVSHIDYIKYINNNYRLWTIKDAKDGDVLVSNHSPFIYNGKFNETTFGAYCGLNVINSFVVSTGEIRWTSSQFIKPATKEQIDTLIKKMAEAGYIFDFNKKELKKMNLLIDSFKNK